MARILCTECFKTMRIARVSLPLSFSTIAASLSLSVCLTYIDTRKNVDYRGMQNLIAALKRTDHSRVRTFVFLSSSGVQNAWYVHGTCISAAAFADNGDVSYAVRRSIALNISLGNYAKWKLAGEFGVFFFFSLSMTVSICTLCSFRSGERAEKEWYPILHCQTRYGFDEYLWMCSCTCTTVCTSVCTCAWILLHVPS